MGGQEEVREGRKGIEAQQWDIWIRILVLILEDMVKANEINVLIIDIRFNFE